MAFGFAYARHLRDAHKDPLRMRAPRPRRRSVSERTEDAVVGYAAAIAAVGAATLARMLIGDASVGYVGAIAIAVAIGGAGPGIVATVLALLGLRALFGAPVASTAIEALLVIGAGAAARRIARAGRRPRVGSREVQGLVRSARAASLRADVALAVLRSPGREALLRATTEAIVRHLGAAHAHVWIEGGEGLVLRASSSSHVALGRLGPFGSAGSLPSDVVAWDTASLLVGLGGEGDDRERRWFDREGLCAFAGQPLRAGGRAVGAIAIYARARLGDEELRALGAVAALVSDALAQGEREGADRASANPSDSSIEAAPASATRVIAAA